MPKRCVVKEIFISEWRFGKIQQISGLEHRLDEINEIPKNERRLKSVEEHLKMLEQEEQKYQTLRQVWCRRSLKMSLYMMAGALWYGSNMSRASRML